MLRIGSFCLDILAKFTHFSKDFLESNTCHSVLHFLFKLNTKQLMRAWSNIKLFIHSPYKYFNHTTSLTTACRQIKTTRPLGLPCKHQSLPRHQSNFSCRTFEQCAAEKPRSDTPKTEWWLCCIRFSSTTQAHDDLFVPSLPQPW